MGKRLSLDRVKAMVLPFGLMAMIFILSSIPGRVDQGGLKFLVDIDPDLQNLLHIPLFGMLEALWLRAFAKYEMTERKLVVTSLVVSVGYGCLDEFHQMYVPGRYASLTDIALNFTGVALGALLFLSWQKNKKAKQRLEMCFQK